MPQVSICIPVYKVERYIERCIRSICEQTIKDIEIICINDCTPDNSWTILKKIINDYPNRNNQIILLENKSNFGPGISRQRCAQVASGEYIYFADADDWLEKGMIEKMYVRAKEIDADILGCQVKYIPRNGSAFNSDFKSDFTKEEWISQIINWSNLSISIALWTRLIRRSIYLKTLVSEDQLVGLVRYEDFINVVKCHYYANRVYWLNETLYNHDWSNSDSITKVKDKKAVQSCIRVGTELEEFFHTKDITTFDNEINRFKLKAKNNLIMSSLVYDPQYWRELWPELNKYKNISTKSKIGMWLADHKFDNLLRLCNYIHSKIRFFYNNN